MPNQGQKTVQFQWQWREDAQWQCLPRNPIQGSAIEDQPLQIIDSVQSSRPVLPAPESRPCSKKHPRRCPRFGLAGDVGCKDLTAPQDVGRQLRGMQTCWLGDGHHCHRHCHQKATAWKRKRNGNALSEGCTPNGASLYLPKTALIYSSCVFEFLKSTYSVDCFLVGKRKWHSISSVDRLPSHVVLLAFWFCGEGSEAASEFCCSKDVHRRR